MSIGPGFSGSLAATQQVQVESVPSQYSPATQVPGCGFIL